MAKKKNLPINNLDEQVLRIIPNVGKVTTERILSARDEAQFTSASDMAERVSGISEEFASEWFRFPAEEQEEVNSFEGFDFSDPDVESETESAEAEEETEGKSRPWLKPLLIGLLVLSVLAGVFFVGRASKNTMAAEEEPVVETTAPLQEKAEEPEPTKVPEEPASSPELPEVAEALGASVLTGENGRAIGHVFFPNLEGAPTVNIAVDEGGFTIIALGKGAVNDYWVSPVAADIGHVVLIKGRTPDGDTPDDLNNTVEMYGYIPGHVGVTQIYESEESVSEAKAAGTNMHSAPNCGSEGCNDVYVWELTTGGLELLAETHK